MNRRGDLGKELNDRESLSLGINPDTGEKFEDQEKKPKLKRNFPLFLHPKTLEQRIKDVVPELGKPIVPDPGDILTYHENTDLYKGFKVSYFKNEKDKVCFIMPGNRIKSQSSAIYTLQTNLLIKRYTDTRVSKNAIKYSNGTFPTGTFCAEVTGFTSSKKISQISRYCHFFNEGDIFEYFSENVNAELESTDQRISRRAPPSSMYY